MAPLMSVRNEETSRSPVHAYCRWFGGTRRRLRVITSPIPRVSKPMWLPEGRALVAMLGQCDGGEEGGFLAGCFQIPDASKPEALANPRGKGDAGNSGSGFKTLLFLLGNSDL